MEESDTKTSAQGITLIQTQKPQQQNPSQKKSQKRRNNRIRAINGAYYLHEYKEELENYDYDDYLTTQPKRPAYL